MRWRNLILPTVVAAASAVALTAAPASANANRVVVNSSLYPSGTASVDIESSNPDGSPALSTCANVGPGQQASVNVFVADGDSVMINYYANKGCSGTIKWDTRRAPNPVPGVWNINS
ncbi:hypothetical protein ABZX85_31160 [Streptomyces sp. NPDC004539]|uniref:hypothetical protein n=1 Tax=Streptomyces sp. NPDC004539 TaxID=3154280 RepID=UPI00339F00E0